MTASRHDHSAQATHAVESEPWGTDPADRWVLVYADLCCDGVWHRGGVSDVVGSLPPIPAALADRLRAWTEWHDHLSASNDSFPRPLYWEQRCDAPLAAFNAEGRAIARTLKAALPADWTVIYRDIDAWLRPRDAPIESYILSLFGDD